MFLKIDYSVERTDSNNIYRKYFINLVDTIWDVVYFKYEQNAPMNVEIDVHCTLLTASMHSVKVLKTSLLLDLCKI